MSMEHTQLKRILEAVLLANTHPMTPQQLGNLFTEEEAVSHEEISRALESLQEDAVGRGVQLVEVASGFRYQVCQDVHTWVSRMWTERPSRYSRALLETLALIAYRQPITRGEIEQIRGVVVSSSIVKTLEEREWIRVVGYRDVPGKPALFGTTRAFLDYFNLRSLDELPPLADIRDLDELDPQFNFDQPAQARVAASNDDADAPPAPADAAAQPGADHGTDGEAASTDADDGDGAPTDVPADVADDVAPEPRATAVEAEDRADPDEDASAPHDIEENRT
jgi:segregation and condensation protein B